MDDTDTILKSSAALFEGELIRQTGVLSNTSDRLGPISTSNITLQDGVTYGGIVTYRWASGCEYTSEISYTETETQYDWMVDFVFPDGSVQAEDVLGGSMFMWSDSGTFVNTTTTGAIPIGGTTYFAVAATIKESPPIPDPGAQGVVLAGGTWISRVKCKPTLDWEVSTCTLRNGTWTDCSATPSQNTTEVDEIGLNNLYYYMTGVPFLLYNAPFTYVFGRKPLLTALIFDPASSDIHSHVPSLVDYDRMYGVMAASLASASLAGYYGVAEVPTTGSAPRPVYAVRTYILAIVVVVLVTAPLLTAFSLFSSVLRHLPLRRATFLTIANAVRGSWWDATLWGSCTLPPEKLREMYSKTKVMFGVDVQNMQHIGLAPAVETVREDHLYCGVDEQ